MNTYVVSLVFQTQVGDKLIHELKSGILEADDAIDAIERAMLKHPNRNVILKSAILADAELGLKF